MEDDKEFLETLRDTKRVCAIQFRDVTGNVSTVRAHIVKIESVSDREMIETDAGLLIGVDQIITVDGRPMGDYC